jgi:hypothetical protein
MNKIKTWAQNYWFFIKHYIKFGWEHAIHYIAEIWNEVKKKEHTDVRVGIFVFFYLSFSLVGAYNFAHLIAFGYIIWLLEKDLNKE